MIRIPHQRGGWLEVICGPMFSGKSEEMIRRLRRAEIAGQRVVIFKPQIDDRYDVEDVVSHAGIRMRAVPVSSVPELMTRSAGFDVVGIDEVQFFETSVVGSALELANGGVRVVAAGLDQDFRRLPFGPMPALLSLAEFVDKMHAICVVCGSPAHFTQRTAGGEELVQVGDSESYEARCRACYELGLAKTGDREESAVRTHDRD